MAAPIDTVDDLIEKFIKGDESVIKQLATDIRSSKVQLLEIVEKLGSSLTNTDVNTRCRATQLLACILHCLPNNWLPEKEAEVLCAFFCDRLKDHYSVTPHVMYGMLALSNAGSLSDGSAQKLVQSMFSELQVQTMPQKERLHVLTIIFNLLQYHLQAMQQLGSTFVYGYIQAIDAEKDPRNLIIAFKSVRVIAQNFKIASMEEELFEVVACYFPIDFTPPLKDPYGVKKEELINCLREALSSSPLFAEYCLPLLLEKMSSTVISAKIDALKTLSSCAEVYGSYRVLEHLDSLWSNIRREVFTTPTEAVELAALEAWVTVVRTLSAGSPESKKKSPLSEAVQEMFSDCEKHILEPERPMLGAVGKLLSAAASASEPACHMVVDKALPLLLEQFHAFPQAGQRKIIVELLLGLISIATSVCTKENPFEKYKQTFFSILISMLNDSSSLLKSTAIKGINQCLCVPNMVEEKEQQLVALYYTDLMMKDKDVSIRTEATSAMGNLAVCNGEVVDSKVLPRLFEHIPLDERMEVDDGGDNKVHYHKLTPQYIYNCLTSISANLQIMQKVLARLLRYWENLGSKGTSTVVKQESDSVGKCILNIIDSHVQDQAASEFLVTDVLPKIFEFAVGYNLPLGENNEILVHIIRGIACKLDLSVASDVASRCVDAFSNGNITALCTKCNQEISNIKFSPLSVDSVCEQTRLVEHFTAVACSLPKEVPQSAEILNKLLNLSLNSKDTVTWQAAAKCFAGLINKFPQGEGLDECLAEVKKGVHSTLTSDNATVEQKRQYLYVWSYITKALVLRGHNAQNEYLNLILGLFEDETLAKQAVQGFGRILEECKDVLNDRMKADIKIMFKQRLFVTTMPQLLDGFKKTQSNKKQHYLTAVTILFRHVPKQVLLTELVKLMPLLVQSLQTDIPDALVSSLTALHDVMKDAQDLMSTHVDDVIPRLLHLAESNSYMKVRSAALQCLGEITCLPHYVLYPHKTLVIRSLAKSLDDRKRLVRKEAVAARTEWYLLGTDAK